MLYYEIMTARSHLVHFVTEWDHLAGFLQSQFSTLSTEDLNNNKHLRTKFFMWLGPSGCSDLFILYFRFYVHLIFQQFGGLIWKWHLPCVCIFSDDPTAWAVLLAACQAENTIVHLHNKQSKQTHLEKMIVTAISAKSEAAFVLKNNCSYCCF